MDFDFELKEENGSQLLSNFNLIKDGKISEDKFNFCTNFSGFKD